MLESENKQLNAENQQLIAEKVILENEKKENKVMRDTFQTISKERDALDGRGLTNWKLDELNELVKRQKKAQISVKKLIDECKFEEIKSMNQFREERLCVICMEQLKDSLLLPCKHLVTCTNCTKKTSNCAQFVEFRFNKYTKCINRERLFYPLTFN